MTYATYPSLTDRGILVSGGATGIGASIVSEFAQQGARVAFVDINDQAATALIEALDDQGVRHKPVYSHLDLRDLNGLPAAVAGLADAVGGIHALVNNAADDTRHTVAEVTPDYWRDRMAVNLDHQFFMAQAVVPAMTAARAGSIINMGSISWRIGLGNMSAYVTAKAAIEGMTNGLARDLGEHNVRVNCIIPGFIKTQRQIDKWLTPELERIVLDGQCIKQLIEPGYVARLIAFLAADDSAMCTSGTYTVDAGWI